MHRCTIILAITLVLLALTACDAADPVDASLSDSGARLDASTGLDAAVRDAALSDAALTDAALSDAGEPATYACTRVIGYSQSNQWFMVGGVFEGLVPDAAWELMWTNGASLETYRRADSPAWDAPVRSRCAGGLAPDRVIFNLAGMYGDDPPAWAAAIAEVIANLRVRYPGVRSIVLQAIVGGPLNGPCSIDDAVVAASASHPHQDAAIAAAVGGDVVAGPSPEVRTCADYRDPIGHLTEPGARAAATAIGEYYRDR